MVLDMRNDLESTGAAPLVSHPRPTRQLVRRMGFYGS